MSEPTGRPRRNFDIDDETHKIDELMGLANEVKVSAQEYYELFVDTYPLVADAFYDDVVHPIADEDYPLAVSGLGDFISRVYDNDPLMRLNTPGIKERLHPALFLLALAQQNGVI